MLGFILRNLVFLDLSIVLSWDNTDICLYLESHSDRFKSFSGMNGDSSLMKIESLLSYCELAQAKKKVASLTISKSSYFWETNLAPHSSKLSK